MTTTAAGWRRPGLLALTGVAWLYVLLGIPVLALFILEVVFIPLTIITVGLFALVVIVPAVGVIATAHRRLARYVLGEQVPAPYKPTREGVLPRLAGWMRDPARWRDLLWLLVACTFGWVIALLAALFVLYFLWFAAFPLVWGVTPHGVFDQQLGFMTIDTQAESFLNWIPAVLALLLWWFATPALVRLHAWLDRELLSSRTQRLEERVTRLSESRSETIDFSAAELRRIERDLHDGAQARLVSLGMSLGMADELMAEDPEAARRLLAEARTTTTAALGDLRSVVRGMHPPVLADRGLVGAVQALALDLALPVTVSASVPGRPPAPVESAVYFAVAESLANVAKHAKASRAWVDFGYARGVLRVEVGDDGVGGADHQAGTGMVGVARRLAAFDGTMAVSSPAGGPTLVTLELPCTLSPGTTG